MIEARVAGVPMPESFIASRSSASSTSLPAVSIAPSSEASVKRRGGWVSLRIDSTDERLDRLALLELRAAAGRRPSRPRRAGWSASSPYTAFQPASISRRPLVRKTCSTTVVSTRVRS